MALITKNQIKARAKKIYEQLEEIKMLLDDLREEAQEEYDNIEPYDGKDFLTEQQEERLEWLEEVTYYLDQEDNLDQVLEELENIIFR